MSPSSRRPAVPAWVRALARTLLGVAAGALLGLGYSFLSRSLGST